ncbi:MFS family permease [Mycolicibacterium iranicum]|uniref:MFS family permease n=1 Tax=Mycolicibacterium iranicum TaxID=912594 RepID=A0A839QB21_MYCIR|nr:MFS transporter [Mycolicibacterium iranicum]MBB2989741.1 MFS family permease [Mycolicibacterium iranicum]
MTPPTERKRRLLLDVTPFRSSRAFTRLWVGTALGSIGQEMTVVTVALQVYAITSSTFAVSLIAGIALGPIIIGGLYGGTLADRFDRRRVAWVASVISWVAIVVLAVHAVLGGTSLWLLYTAATVNAAAGTVGGITRRAIIPRLLPQQLLPAAGALNGINLGLMATLGPLLGATAVNAGGFHTAYLIDVALHCAAFLGVFTLPALRPVDAAPSSPLRAVADGLSFLRRASNVRFSLTLDAIAMGLAQPRVLFPALGAVTMGGGVTTVGVLAAAAAAGTMLMGFFSGWTGSIRRQGQAILVVTYVYGVTVVAAGAVVLVAALRPHPGGTNVAAIAALAVVLAVGGAVDNIGAIYRMAMLQAAVPDNIRGRVQSLYTLVVTGGPRIGDVVSGVVASALFLWSPLLAGGLVMILLTWVLTRRTPAFKDYDAENPQP